jgi:hypothetical protein
MVTNDFNLLCGCACILVRTEFHLDVRESLPEKGLESVTCHSPDGGGAT